VSVWGWLGLAWVAVLALWCWRALVHGHAVVAVLGWAALVPLLLLSLLFVIDD